MPWDRSFRLRSLRPLLCPTAYRVKMIGPLLRDAAFPCLRGVVEHPVGAITHAADVERHRDRDRAPGHGLVREPLVRERRREAALDRRLEGAARFHDDALGLALAVQVHGGGRAADVLD